MLQNVIEYLMQNPDVKEKLIDGSACLIGLTEIEQKAVLDVFDSSDNIIVSPLVYW